MGKPVELPQGALEMLLVKAVSLGALHGDGILLRRRLPLRAAPPRATAPPPRWQILSLSRHAKRAAGRRTPGHPGASIAQPRRLGGEQDRSRRRRAGVGKLDVVALAGIKQTALRMADCIARFSAGRGRTCQAQLLDRRLALVPEGELDTVSIGAAAHQHHRTGNLRPHLLRAGLRNRHHHPSQSGSLPHAASVASRRPASGVITSL